MLIDGLRREEVREVGSGLRRQGIATEKIRGVRDETSALVRLADAVAGVVRERAEGVSSARRLVTLGLDHKTLRVI